MIARWLAASLFFTLLLAAWYMAAEAHIWSPLLLPSPLSVLEYLWSAVEDGTLVEAAGVTIQRLLIGYGCSAKIRDYGWRYAIIASGPEKP